jgi:homospermidine synthase
MSNQEFSVQKTTFCGRVLLIGYGGVAKCLTQLLLRHLDMDFSKMTIIDPIDYREAAKDLLSAGATYKLKKITKENMCSVLGEHVSAGDMVIDLSVNVGTLSVAGWCFKNNVMYINTSVEEWWSSINDNWADDTLYRRHVELASHMSSLGNNGPTVVVEHGANPGLASHWTKQALEDVAKRILQSPVLSLDRRTGLEASLDNSDFARMAMLTGTKVVHISERDTQKTDRLRQPGEFLSTWSCDGFYQESLAITEIAWGTHERTLPDDAITYNWGPGNQISINRRALDVNARSWIPSGEIEGTIAPHGEAFTISEKLTWRQNGQVVYRPSVYFVYCPTDVAVASMAEYADTGTDSFDTCRVMTNEIVSGVDEVGVLLLGHDLGGWWVGSRLSIEETRKHVKDQNATVLQVAASVLAALSYMIRNPRRGFCRVEDFPHAEILSTASPYLGECISMQTDWTPAPNHLRRNPQSCQFADFCVQPTVPSKAVSW